MPSRSIRMESFPVKIVSDFTPEILERNVLEDNFEAFVTAVLSGKPILGKCDRKIKHSYPFFGMINAFEWFSFIEIHMRHHERQKKRLEKINTL